MFRWIADVVDGHAGARRDSRAAVLGRREVAAMKQPGRIVT
jgi:hypothetical protein